MGDENLEDLTGEPLPATKELVVQIACQYFRGEDYRINVELSLASFSHLLRVSHRPTLTHAQVAIDADVLKGAHLTDLVKHLCEDLQHKLFHYRAVHSEESNRVVGPLSEEVEALLALMDVQCLMFECAQNQTMAYYLAKRGQWAEPLPERMLQMDIVRWQVYLSGVAERHVKH